MEYVKAKLQALRVDACTTEVKQCLQSENNCGEGYINCIGLDKDTIVKMCTNSATNFKLMACQSKFRNNQYEVQNYVAQVAQGLILNMDNAALSACQDAAKKAMTDFCGSDTECKGEKLDSVMTFNNADSLTGKLRYRFCPMNATSGKIAYSNCKAVAGALTKADYTSDTNVWVPDLEHALNFACFAFNDGTIDVNGESVVDLKEQAEYEQKDDEVKKEIADARKKAYDDLVEQSMPKFAYDCKTDDDSALEEEANRVAGILTRKVKNILGRIETDNTVKQCVMGRDLKGITTYTNINSVDNTSEEKAFDDMWTMKSTSGVGKGAFPNLMAQYRNIVADAVLGAAAKKYEQEYDNFVSVNEPKAEKELKDRFAAIQKEMDEVERSHALLIANKAACDMEAVNMTNEFYRMTKHNRKYMQVRIEKGWTHRLLGFARKKTTGVMTDTYMKLLKDAAGSAYVPNKYLINVETTWEDNSDKTTGVCNFKIGLYECDNFKDKRVVLGERIHYCDGVYTKFIKNITTKTAVSDSAVKLN